jgi:xanthine dehydrogenase accessory factor
VSRIYEKLIQIQNSNQKAVLCTIIGIKGSTPRKAGAKMIVFENGSIEGTIGGGALEKAVISQALGVLKDREAKTVRHNLVADLAMCCGGSVELFIEPVMNNQHIYIFGAGHIGKALAKFAIDLDFSVTLIDARYDAFDNMNIPGCRIIQDHHTTAIEQLHFNENAYIVILTHDHAFDREVLALCSKREHAYIGMVGSERKVAIARKNLITSGLLSDSELENIDMPIGIEMAAKTPSEIAISILAKLIDTRNKKH